jgi:Glu-tRNA(Gln) amidotransferase subunit E-like FAD-binding protein
MAELDYEILGLKCGLEIHQQLDSSKLFCNCPSVLRKDEPDFIVKRKLHAVAGETGDVDVAAQYQAALGKEFVYQGYNGTTCLVELDEEPPHEINQEALKIAMHISLLLNCEIVPVGQIMRKAVVDGSNTGGFQRSVLIARDGFIETKHGRVGIQYVYLEEDAARKVSKDGNIVVFRLDRLGIPLVEIVTAPDIKTPEQAKEVALHIGQILRACKVRRGIGTIRQDVNVSISGHPRAEIKGFQDPKIFVKVVEKEVQRQLADLEQKKKELKPEVRGANPDGSTKYLRPLPGSARMYPETDLPLLKISRQMINDAKKTLPKLKHEVEEELEKEGLNKEMISLLLKQGKLEEFKELVKVIEKPGVVAKTLLIFPKEIASKEGISLKKVEKVLGQDSLSHVLENLKKGKITEKQIKHVLAEIVKGKSHTEAVKVKKADLSGLDEKIMNLIKSKPGLSENAYMGIIMKEIRGKADGARVLEIIKKYLG